MKTERFQLRAFVVFLFLVVALSLASASFAAVTTTPTVAGYARDSITGGYLNNRAGSGQALFDAASRTYGSTGSFNVGGKSMSVPTKIPIASTAGAIAKNAMRLNPYAIAGTLAAGWLFDQGMQYIDGSGWVKDNATPATYDGNFWYNNIAGSACQFTETTVCDAPTAIKERLIYGNGALDWRQTAACSFTTTTATCPGEYTNDGTNWYAITKTAYRSVRAADVKVPASDSDWDNLPDPTQNGPLAEELPRAAYMPEGASVNAPTYDFAPFSAPTGEPYKKPDGSTVQPMVTVSPNNTSITYNTYNQTTINNLGQPVTDAPPIDENADEVKDPCDSHPERAGCAELGTDDFKLGKETVTMVFTPEASPISGSCPAPISLPNGGVLSWEPACNAMVQIKPIVLALAGMMTAFMVIGAMRS